MHDPLVLSLVGGLLIGIASITLFVAGHRIAGISGILGGLIEGSGDRAFRLAFIGGLVLTGIVGALLAPSAIVSTDAPIGRIVLGGLLVGFGTRLGNGCTSGHGVCGMSRLSPRSMIATMTFVGTGMITVTVFRAILGDAP